MPGYNYSDSYLAERASSGGKDPGRKRTAEELAMRARAGDQAALSQLIDLSGGPGDPNPSNNWATADAMNYGKLMLRDLIPNYTPIYDKAKDGSNFFDKIGSTVGGVLKTAAPLAGFIPGIGPLAAAGIAAGASAGGGALRDEPFSLGKTALAGLAGYGGNALLGGEGPAGIKGIPSRLGLGGSPSIGNTTAQGTVGAAADGGGLLGTGIRLGDIARYAPLAIGALGAVGNYQDQARANALRERGIAAAERTYAERQPFRTKALGFAGMPDPERPDLSGIFSDPGNPYNRVKRY